MVGSGKLREEGHVDEPQKTEQVYPPSVVGEGDPDRVTELSLDINKIGDPALVIPLNC